jgi:hypothetical protein
MAFFIFTKNSDNIENTLYKISENLNDLNILQNSYKIIEDTQENFNSVKYGTKCVTGYNNNNIQYNNCISSFFSKEDLFNYIKSYKNSIKAFIDNNPNSSVLNIWNNYYNQLNSLNLNTITFPLNKSLEQYFNDLGQPSLNPLQLP